MCRQVNNVLNVTGNEEFRSIILLIKMMQSSINESLAGTLCDPRLHDARAHACMQVHSSEV